MDEKNQMIITFNGKDYLATYNVQTDYYEVEIKAPEVGGIYYADIDFIDLFEELSEERVPIQVWAKEEIVIETNKIFMWIFDYYDFKVKDIVEISDFELNIDEETNSTSTINVLKKNDAKAKDIVMIKRNNEIIYWGIIQEIQNTDGESLYQYTVKYITNLFDREIILENEDLIKTDGVEDFIADAITNNYIENEDTFINLNWLVLDVKTHNKKQVSVSNVENNIYNLHTWITNCTQNYDIVYSFSIVGQKLVMTIEKEDADEILIDVNAQPISDYTEVFETDITAKVTVLYDYVDEEESPGEYTLYLLNDRTTTTDMSDENRAEGGIETIYTQNYEDAEQTALDAIKSNSYNHNITFSYYDRYIQVGTPVTIKTKESLIFDTYISAITMTNSKFYQYTCGNIRIDFIDKLLKERSN